jgi:mxaL protein
VKAIVRAIAFVRTRRLAVLMLAALVLLPVFFAPKIMLPGGTYAWLFVIDATESMNVRDVDAAHPDESRLAFAKASVVAALARLPCGSRASVALFAGVDTLTLFEPLEVCAHFPAIEKVVSGLDWRMAWDGDSRIEPGLVNAFHEAESRHLDLAFVTDGDEAPHVDEPRLGDLLAVRGPVKGVILGVGSTEPHPVPRLDDDDRIVGYWSALDAAREGFHPNLVETLASGASDADLAKSHALDDIVEHRSALRPAYLAELANAAGLDYVTADSTQRLASSVTNRSFERVADAERDLRFVFGLGAAALIAIDWLIAHGRRLRGARRISRVSRGPATA